MTNQWKKWGISRKMRPIFPLQKKDTANKLLSTREEIKTNRLISLTLYKYISLFSLFSIYVCVTQVANNTGIPKSIYKNKQRGII